MPFEIIRNDITNMQVDAIVNTASPEPVVGYGVDAGINQKAGPKLLEARKKIGKIRVGSAAITPGFNLSAKYVIHAVGPVWQGGNQGEEKLLRKCYESSLRLARWRRCESIAFPLMCAGNHGFPKQLALNIALDVIQNFLKKHEMHIVLVVFSRDAFRLSESVQQNIASFIDDHYIDETNLKQYGVADKCSVRGIQQTMILQKQMDQRHRWILEEQERCQWEELEQTGELPDLGSLPLPSMFMEKAEEVEDACDDRPTTRRKAKAVPSLPRLVPAPKPKPTLKELLEHTDAGFSETLLKLIDQTGKKDSEVYNKANVSRQHFSKIRNNPDYKPTKPTAIAFAIALELDLDQTRDLIGRAGYALTNSSKFDVIIMYFIQQRNYNMFDINAALFEFDQSLLGA